MNRFIMGRLGLFTLLAALAAVGCAVEQASQGEGDQTEEGEDASQMVGLGTSGDEQVSAGEHPVLRHATNPPGKPDNGVCPGCGPLPDPWKKMGPLPDPWTNPGSSSGTSGGSTTSSSGSSGKP